MNVEQVSETSKDRAPVQAPVEPAPVAAAPAPAEIPAEPVVETPAAPVEETPEQKADKEKHEHQNKVQRRIDKLTAEKYQLKGRLETLERIVSQQAQPQQQQTGEPVRENFTDDLAFLTARQDWMFNQHRQTQQQSEQQRVQSTWAERENKLRAEKPDYDEVVEDAADIMVPPAAVDAITASEAGPEIRYYLAKNPNEAARLMRYQNPIDQIRAIGQIEARLEIEKKAQTVKTTPKPTAAPKPITPVGGSGGPEAIDESKLSDDEWAKRRKQKRLKEAGILT